MKKKTDAKDKQSSRAPRKKKPAAPPPPANQTHRSVLGSCLRILGIGITFTFVTTICAGVGATIALVAPLDLLPFVKDSEVAPPVRFEDIFGGGLQFKISRPINLLVMGVDRNLEAEEGSPDVFKSRSDTMLLIRLNPENRRASVLSIPRDTRVLIPNYGYTKINAANFEGGPQLAIDVVSETLNDVPIDRYVRISTGAFREFVDIVGGVELFVPTRMEYEDKTQGLVIDLEPGLQTLNGEQAEGFMRYREDLGDIGRAQRQQELIKALQKQLATPATLTRLPQLLSVLQKHLDTNLTINEMLALGQFSLQLDRDQLHMVMLPGRFSGPKEYDQSFWIMKSAAIDQLMLSYFDVQPPQDRRIGAIRDERRLVDRIRISVQNASGDPEGGTRMVAYLQSLGFNRVSVGTDWPQIVSKTQVIPQWGDIQAATEVEQLLAESELEVNSTGDLSTELTIRVGKAWLRTPQAQSPEPS